MNIIKQVDKVIKLDARVFMLRKDGSSFILCHNLRTLEFISYVIFFSTGSVT